MSSIIKCWITMIWCLASKGNNCKVCLGAKDWNLWQGLCCQQWLLQALSHAVYFLLAVEFEAHLDAESYGNAMCPPRSRLPRKQLHMCGSGAVLALLGRVEFSMLPVPSSIHSFRSYFCWRSRR